MFPPTWQAKDRSLVARRMREHIHSPNTTPLLVFPEGTCVNNEYAHCSAGGACLPASCLPTDSGVLNICMHATRAGTA